MSEHHMPIKGAVANQDHELVTCVLGGVEFGLDINAVKEIVRLPKITPVPRSPGYVEGVANLRGNVLPIINSRARFGMPEGGDTDNNRVVVVELNGHPTGLIVDAVREVMHVQHKDVEAAPAAVQSVNGRFLTGVVKLNGGKRLILLLDHNAILESVQESVKETLDQFEEQLIEPSKEKTSTEDHEHLVTFRIGEEEYGISIMDVQEIIRVPNINTIPNAPPGVVGIASLRNRILPVLDLRTKFGFRSLKAELEAFSAKVKGFEDLYADSVEKLSEAIEMGLSFDRNRLRTHRDFERWHEGVSRRDPLLQSLLAPILEALKDSSTHLLSVVNLVESRQKDAAQREMIGPFRQLHLRLIGLFEKLYTGIARRDDERCLVVSVNGASLALRVDAVNQVLQTPRSTVEGTPTIISGESHERDQLRGIAKMDNGKRLIMLLAVDNLITRSEMKTMERVVERGVESSEQSRVSGGSESDERQLVTFKVANEEFAVDIMQVQEIIRLEKVTKMPHVPDFVEGVVNLRGNVLPVIDLRKRVHLASKDYSDATRVVVVDLKGTKTGIIVDSVSEVMRVHTRDIEPAPAIVRSRYGDHIIEGVGKLNKGERMFLLLRADELLKCEDALPASPA